MNLCLTYCIFHLQNLVDVMLKSAKTGIVLSTSSWKEQFIEALTVSAGESTRRAHLSTVMERFPYPYNNRICYCDAVIEKSNRFICFYEYRYGTESEK